MFGEYARMLAYMPLAPCPACMSSCTSSSSRCKDPQSPEQLIEVCIDLRGCIALMQSSDQQSW